MGDIAKILNNNRGQVLTDELIAGIVQHAQTPEDLSIASRINFGVRAYAGVSFRVERLSHILEEMKPLHRLQWDEVEDKRGGMNPDYPGYIRNEMAGKYIQFTARSRVGEIVGGCGVYIYSDMHNQRLSAKEDTIFLLKDFRKGRTAIKFFRYIEEMLVNVIGIEQASLSVKTMNGVYRLWEREGYEVTDRGLTKIFY